MAGHDESNEGRIAACTVSAQSIGYIEKVQAGPRSAGVEPGCWRCSTFLTNRPLLRFLARTLTTRKRNILMNYKRKVELGGEGGCSISQFDHKVNRSRKFSNQIMTLDG